VRATMTLREQVEGRLHAAMRSGGPGAVTPRGGNRYRVQGRTDVYDVSVVGGKYGRASSYACSCPASMLGHRACWHAAAVFLFHVAHTTLVEAA
jgi:uncharacterized Zn finger protein